MLALEYSLGVLSMLFFESQADNLITTDDILVKFIYEYPVVRYRFSDYLYYFVYGIVEIVIGDQNLTGLN